MVEKSKKPAKKATKNVEKSAKASKTTKTTKKAWQKDYFSLFSKTLSCIFAVLSLIFIIRVALSNFLPAKFFWPLLLVLGILNLAFLHTTFTKGTKKLHTILFDIFASIISIGLVISGLKLNELSGFIDKNFVKEKKYSVYNVIVNKKSKSEKMGDLKGGEIFTYDEPVKEVKNKDLESAIQKEIEGSIVSFRDELDIVMNRAANLEDAGSVVNNGTYESYISVNEDYADKIKIIGEIKIEVKDNDDSEEEEAINSDLDKTPFLLLISGIDTRTGTMPTRSLSDVNILAAVNPKTKNIILSAIPRDMYVQLHGTTGLRDKLTHAGAQGGVELTKSTIEDFIGLKIDRYIRVNFNFVTDLVDNIGGITVTNDLDRTLKLDGCVYQPGDNAVDGKCALRFARERKSYTTGDRHRGENQEQVITKIVDKISHDKAIIADSGKILNVMNGSFNTNISSDDIKALIKMQLSDMSSWKTESYNINGSGSLTKTFSYPNQNLYVMVPDENTVATAKEKLSKNLEK